MVLLSLLISITVYFMFMKCVVATRGNVCTCIDCVEYIFLRSGQLVVKQIK